MTELQWIIVVVLGAVALNLLATAAVHAQPLPQPETGQCPSGYVQSGSYCASASSRSKPAVSKVGQYPSGWVQSDDYCGKS